MTGNGHSAPPPAESGRATTEVAEPAEIRRCSTPAARSLAGLAAALDDMQAVLGCCEHLLSTAFRAELAAGSLVSEALWTTALVSYGRCFAAGAPLGEADLVATEMAGDLVGWHRALLRMGEHFTAPGANPREQCQVGLALDSGGAVVGVALTSTRQPGVDELTVRQTGALAVALCTILDARITERQQAVRAAGAELGPAELARLPVMDVARREDGPGGDG